MCREVREAARRPREADRPLGVGRTVWPVRTRTAVALVVSATLLLAVPFAVAAWAFGGRPGLLAFVAPLAGLLAVTAAVAEPVRRSGGRDRRTGGAAGPVHRS